MVNAATQSYRFNALGLPDTGKLACQNHYSGRRTGLWQKTIPMLKNVLLFLSAENTDCVKNASIY